mmetsp:Transcript_3003/g.7923  ORF Transcript_3003/g.7923 Transcript_3003/m.7923 type:complete len:100 (+) Transcript_3003:53-352(+)
MQVAAGAAARLCSSVARTISAAVRGGYSCSKHVHMLPHGGIRLDGPRCGDALVGCDEAQHADWQEAPAAPKLSLFDSIHTALLIECRRKAVALDGVPGV